MMVSHMMNWYPWQQMMYGNFWLMSWFPFLVLLVVLDLFLRGIALWRSARSNQVYWFIALLIFNTAGILPLIYLVWFTKKTKR